MAHPFNPTTLGKYMVWARDSGGCTCQTTHTGKNHCVKFVSGDGKRLAVVTCPQDEILTFEMIAYLDRKGKTMDAKQLNEMLQQDETDTNRLLRLIESLPPTREIVVRTFLSNDTRDPWRGGLCRPGATAEGEIIRHLASPSVP